MALMGRQKGVIAALAFYWPAVFAIAHVPIPEVVRQARMSDKSLHLLVYMILTFLLQSAIRPRENWSPPGGRPTSTPPSRPSAEP